MIFIHGESYSRGTGNAYDASVLASFGDVLVVTINYRLGVLGFLSTTDSVASGNYAILDIIAGIHWVKQNIMAFRGNPNKITLFGQGHGAALINILLVSKMARGNLFQGAILQSGTALSAWATSYKPEECVEQIAKYARCPGLAPRNNTAIIDCLKNATLAKLINFEPFPPKYRTCFSPVSFKRNGVLSKSPTELHQESVSGFLRHPLLIGVTKYDALYWVRKDDFLRKIDNPRREKITRTFVNNIFDYNRQAIFTELEWKYTDWGNLYQKRSTNETIISMVSDGLYVVPAIDVARYHSMVGQTYFYAFGNDGKDTNDTLGSFHGDDLVYVFGYPVIPESSPYTQRYTDHDIQMSKIVMTYWTNFAKSGNPSEPNVFKEITSDGKHIVSMQWPKYNENSGAYTYLGGKSKIRYHYRNSKVPFWIRRIRRLLQNANTTNRRSNLLDFSHNMSYFDEPQSLTNYQYLLQLTPPTTLPTTTVYQHVHGDNSLSAIIDNSQPGSDILFGRDSGHDGKLKTHPHPGNSIKEDNNSMIHLQTIRVKSSAISLNITIAIGCSLLFLNTIAFIGIYHQKRRLMALYRTKQRPRDASDHQIPRVYSRNEIENSSLLDECQSSVVVKGHKSAPRSVRISDSPKMARKYPLPCGELPSGHNGRQKTSRDTHRPTNAYQCRSSDSVSTFR